MQLQNKTDFTKQRPRPREPGPNPSLHSSVLRPGVKTRDRPKPVFLVSAVAESGAVTEVQLWP